MASSITSSSSQLEASSSPDIASFTVDELCTYLEKENFSADVIEAFYENEVNGSLFLDLSEENMKEVSPTLRERIRLRKLQKTQAQVHKHAWGMGVARGSYGGIA